MRTWTSRWNTRQPGEPVDERQRPFLIGLDGKAQPLPAGELGRPGKGGDDVEREVQALGGLDTVKRRLPPESTVIVRQGAAGVAVSAGGQEPFTVPSIKVKAVDTSGAGDVHVGAVGLRNGNPTGTDAWF